MGIYSCDYILYYYFLYHAQSHQSAGIVPTKGTEICIYTVEVQIVSSIFNQDFTEEDEKDDL